MSIAPVNKTSSGKLGTYVKNTLLALVGLGSAAGVTGGYLQLKNEINTSSTQITSRLDESERTRGNLAEELQRANATIARLGKDLTAKDEAIKAANEQITRHEQELGKTREVVTTMSSDVKNHSNRIGNLDEKLGVVSVKIGGLEKKVSVSDLQDIYNKAVSSAVLVEIEIRHKEKEKDDKGNEVEVEKSHTHSGSGYVVAHINGGKGGGYIGTNWHVLECGQVKEEDYKNMDIVLHLPDGKTVKAKPHLYKDKTGKEELARNKEHDLVLLKTTEDITKTIPVSFASENPKPGEAVMVVGGPFSSDLGFRFSGSFGIVSGDSVVEFGKGDPVIHTTNQEKTKSALAKGTTLTTRTDAAIVPGNSGGLGFRVRDGKIIFMPTFVYSTDSPPATMGFGVTAPIIRDNIKTWILYDLNADGSFIERKAESPKSLPVKGKTESPQNKQSRLWYERNNPLVHKSELKSYNTRVLAGRRYS